MKSITVNSKGKIESIDESIMIGKQIKRTAKLYNCDQLSAVAYRAGGNCFRFANFLEQFLSFNLKCWIRAP